MKQIAPLFILLISLTTAFSQMSADRLTYMTEDYPPANFKAEDGSVQGFATKILREVWKQMGVAEQPITVLAWDDAYTKIQNGSGMMLYGMTRTKERENLFKWVGPIFTANRVLIGIPSDGNKKITDLSTVKEYKIGIIKGDAADETLDSLQVPVEKRVVVSDLNEMKKRLFDHSIDFMIADDDILFNLIKQTGKESVYIAATLESSSIYFAFSKDVSDDLITKYQNSLNAISGTVNDILEAEGIGIFEE